MRYAASDVAAALDGLGVEDAPEKDATSSACFPSIVIGDALSDGVRAILETKPKVRGYFEGRGKTDAIASDGRTLDTSSSGYDYSLALSLAKNGVDDPSELATAIHHRPDGAARAKGPEYIARTVSRALDRAATSTRKSREGESYGPDFRIERIRIFASNPPTYEFTVQGTTFLVTSAELRIKARFATRFMDALRRIPLLPKPDAWRTMVNGWLEQAEIVEMPPEASEEVALREDVERAIERLHVGDNPIDLDGGKAVSLEDGRRAFKTRAILEALKEDRPDLQANAVCRVLKDLGCVSKTPRIGEATMRVWVKP